MKKQVNIKKIAGSDLNTNIIDHRHWLSNNILVAEILFVFLYNELVIQSFPLESDLHLTPRLLPSNQGMPGILE